jgi:hypothetical protein
MLKRFITNFFCWIISAYVKLILLLKRDFGQLEVAESVCLILNSNLLLKILHPFINNPYQQNLCEFIFFQVTKKLNFSPVLLSEVDDFKPLITSDVLPAIVLSTHTGFAFVTRYVSATKKNFYIVSTVIDGKSLRDRFKRSGVTEKVNVILNDKYCLANIREQLAQNATVICCVDHKPVGSENYTLISPNIFKFIHLLNVPVFFHKDEIMPNGHVKINFSKVSALQDPNEMASSFLEYINESRSRKKVFSLSAKEKL